MLIIRPEAFVTQPWKNGGGVTHEIARRADEQGLIWRLSVAEVGADGPFSAFPALTRILTVIEGAGMALEAPGTALAARPLEPVRFSGDLPIFGRLINGPLRDLNVIFDAARITADVSLVTDILPGRAPGAEQALFCLAGSYRTSEGPVGPGAIVFCGDGTISAEPDASALLITLITLTTL
jgi:environmental stress-induced protein Ves